MGEIGNGRLDLIDAFLELLYLALQSIFLPTQFAALVFAGLFFLIACCLANRLACFVGAAIEFFGFGLFLSPLFFQTDQLAQIDLHSTTGAVGLDEINIFKNKFAVQHLGLVPCLLYWIVANSDQRQALVRIPRW